MNYLKHYIKLIRKAQVCSTSGYTERHHVFPKSIFGENNYVVNLTARQHYVAHALLEKICILRYGLSHPFSRKMIHAFFMMNNTQGIGQQRYVNSRLFEASKIRFSERMSGENSPFYGKKKVFSEQHLANMRASRKTGKDSPLFGIPRSEEVKQKMRKPKHEGHGQKVSESKKGRKLSEEHCRHLSESHKGQVPWNKGKTYSEDSRRRMSQAQRNKDTSFITDEYKKKISDSMKRVWAERQQSRGDKEQNQ